MVQIIIWLEKEKDTNTVTFKEWPLRTGGVRNMSRNITGQTRLQKLNEGFGGQNKWWAIWKRRIEGISWIPRRMSEWERWFIVAHYGGSHNFSKISFSRMCKLSSYIWERYTSIFISLSLIIDNIFSFKTHSGKLVSNIKLKLSFLGINLCFFIFMVIGILLLYLAST